MKDYLLKLLYVCAPEDGFAQDAIEYAVLANWVQPGGQDFEADIALVNAFRDDILKAYGEVLARETELRHLLPQGA